MRIQIKYEHAKCGGGSDRKNTVVTEITVWPYLCTCIHYTMDTAPIRQYCLPATIPLNPSEQPLLKMPDERRPRTFRVKSLTEDGKTYVTKYIPEIIPGEDGYPEVVKQKWHCTCVHFQEKGYCKHAIMASYLVNKHWWWMGLKIRYEGTEFEETSEAYIKRHVTEVES